MLLENDIRLGKLIYIPANTELLYIIKGLYKIKHFNKPVVGIILENKENVYNVFNVKVKIGFEEYYVRKLDMYKIKK